MFPPIHINLFGSEFWHPAPHLEHSFLWGTTSVGRLPFPASRLETKPWPSAIPRAIGPKGFFYHGLMEASKAPR